MSDLGKTQEDYAVYLPAISSFYTKQLQKCLDNPDEWRTIDGFEKGLAGLDFLKQDSYFHYPFGLSHTRHQSLYSQHVEMDCSQLTQVDPLPLVPEMIYLFVQIFYTLRDQLTY